MSDGLIESWHWVILSPWSAWFLVLCAIVLILGFIWVVYPYREFKHAWALILVRAVAVLLFFVLLLQPGLEKQWSKPVRKQMTFLLDHTQSMSILNGTQTRFQSMCTHVLPIIRELEQTSVHDVRALNFEHERFDALIKPMYAPTNLLNVLEKNTSSLPQAGVILISDGADMQGEWFDDSHQLKPDYQHRLEALHVPVNTIFVSDNTDFRDIAVADVSGDALAFIKNTFHLEATIHIQGFVGVTLPVMLKSAGKLISQQSIVVQKEGDVHVSFQIKPTQVGSSVYRIEIPIRAEEAIHQNNSKAFIVKVLRDKIRILHVVGSPSYDERFLRQTLKQNSNIDLVSFYILRTPLDDASVPESELSLIPFPVNQLFTSELKNFDVVIFQNFDYRPYRMSQYLPNIEEAVRHGLGFMMLGGASSFAQGGYAQTPIERILPATVNTGEYRLQKVQVRATAQGKHHPIFVNMGIPLESVLEHLPAWNGMNTLGTLQSNASVLLEDALSHAPLLLAQDIEQGRSLSIASDQLWRWRFMPISSDATSFYQRFFVHALQWLVHDLAYEHLSLTLERETYREGESIEAHVRVLNARYEPAPHAAVFLQVLRDDKIVQTIALTTDSEGMAHARLNVLPQGDYTVQAQASLFATEKVQRVFVIEPDLRELMRAKPREDILKAIAQFTHGHFLNLENSKLSDFLFEHAEEQEIQRKEYVSLWDSWIWIVLLSFVWAIDWYLRRRWGFE